MTMRCRTTISCILFLTGARIDATTLRGLVIENELGGPPMANIEISAVAGANSWATQTNGAFKLEFPKKHPGDVVQIVVNKLGYVVVNEVQLRRPLPRDADSEPLTIVLCKAEVREEMARRFYRLKSFEAIEQTYEKRLAELKDGRKADAEALVRLSAERDQAKAAAEKAAEQLAKLRPELTSNLYAEATRLFLEGKVEEAIGVLDEEKLRRSLAVARELRAEAQKAIDEAIQGYLLKAQLLTTQFRFDEAEMTYQMVCDAEPQNFEASFAYAKFSLDLNRYHNALEAYQRCLESARKTAEKANIAGALNGLGNLHYRQNRMGEAHKAYEEALAFRRQLAEQNPETYLHDVAITLNNLGNLNVDRSRLEEAGKAYEEALAIHRQLARQNSQAHLPYVAMTLNGIGIFHWRQNRMEEARKTYEEALATHRQLAEQNSWTYLPYVATTLNNLGVLHRDQRRFEEAYKVTEEALATYRQLAEQNPQTYLPYMATTLNNLGLLHQDQKRTGEAHKAHEEALAIRRRLAEQNPQTYLPDLAMTLSNLGILHKDQNRTGEARKAYEEALSIYEKFARQNPDRYNRDVARVKRLLRELFGAKKEARDR